MRNSGTMIYKTKSDTTPTNLFIPSHLGWTHDQTMRDVETHFELIYPVSNEINTKENKN